MNDASPLSQRALESRIGVLLVNLGSPDEASPAALRRYLREFLSDPRVIEDQGLTWKFVLNAIILTTRPRRRARDYAKIWNTAENEAPLKTITRGQAQKLSAALGGPGISRVVIPSRTRKQLETGGAAFSGPPIVEESVYIPTGRSFYSTTNRAFAVLTTKNLDWITQRYAPEFDAEYRALRETYDSGLGIGSEFGRLATRVLRGRVIHEEGRLAFKSTDDNHHLPFELLSSGTLELLPLINTLSQLVRRARFPNIPTTPVPPFGMVYIEEPELSVFPATQNDLVRLLAWLASEDSLWMSYAITTHSPYVLSAFNNLIEAGQVARAKPELKGEVAKLIPEHYWVKESDFKAYAIEDGVLKSIVAEDTGLVSTNYLDQVSETIGTEFDELLRLGYVES